MSSRCASRGRWSSRNPRPGGRAGIDRAEEMTCLCLSAEEGRAEHCSLKVSSTGASRRQGGGKQVLLTRRAKKLPCNPSNWHAPGKRTMRRGTRTDQARCSHGQVLHESWPCPRSDVGSSVDEPPPLYPTRRFCRVPVLRSEPLTRSQRPRAILPGGVTRPRCTSQHHLIAPGMHVSTPGASYRKTGYSHETTEYRWDGARSHRDFRGRGVHDPQQSHGLPSLAWPCSHSPWDRLCARWRRGVRHPLAAACDQVCW